MRFGERGELHIIVHVTCTLFHFGAWSSSGLQHFSGAGIHYLESQQEYGGVQNVLDGVRGGGEAGPDVPSN